VFSQNFQYDTPKIKIDSLDIVAWKSSSEADQLDKDRSLAPMVCQHLHNAPSTVDFTCTRRNSEIYIYGSPQYKNKSQNVRIVMLRNLGECHSCAILLRSHGNNHEIFSFWRLVLWYFMPLPCYQQLVHCLLRTTSILHHPVPSGICMIDVNVEQYEHTDFVRIGVSQGRWRSYRRTWASTSIWYSATHWLRQILSLGVNKPRKCLSEGLHW
jgi:hypothetical protein